MRSGSLRVALLVISLASLGGCITWHTWGGTIEHGPTLEEHWMGQASIEAHRLILAPSEEAGGTMILLIPYRVVKGDAGTPESGVCRLSLVGYETYVHSGLRKLSPGSSVEGKIGWSRRIEDPESRLDAVVSLTIFEKKDLKLGAEFLETMPEGVERILDLDVPVHLQLRRHLYGKNYASLWWRIPLSPLTAAADAVTFPIQLLILWLFGPA